MLRHSVLPIFAKFLGNCVLSGGNRDFINCDDTMIEIAIATTPAQIIVLVVKKQIKIIYNLLSNTQYINYNI